MAADVEGDFWKDIFVHIQHKNMVRTNVEKLTLENAEEAFDAFARKFPEINVNISKYSSYTTWETFITSDVKLRLFIQNQIKASLMKGQNDDWVKIADAKFPYNPFPEIEEMVNNREKYSKALAELKIEKLQNNKKMKIAGEFIKAYLQNKFPAGCGITWKLNPSENLYVLNINTGKKESSIELTCDDFKNQIDIL